LYLQKLIKKMLESEIGEHLGYSKSKQTAKKTVLPTDEDFLRVSI
jgi:hypothetical protein